MSLGEILDRTIHIYRSRFWIFMGIAALPALAMFGIHIADDAWLGFRALAHPTARNGIIAWNFVVLLVFYHVSAFIGFLFVPSFAWTTAEEQSHRRATIRGALKVGAKRFWTYLKVDIAKLSIQLIAPEMLAAGLALGAGFLADRGGAFDNSDGTLAAFIVLFIPLTGACVLFAWLGACLAYAFPAAVLENLPAWKALKRSWRLSKERRGQTFAVWLLVFLLTGTVSSAMQWAFRWAVIYAYREFHFGSAIFHHFLLASRLLTVVMSAVSHPIQSIALTLLYYDQRVRHEGYDIELLMNAARMESPLPQAPVTPGAESPVPTSAETHVAN